MSPFSYTKKEELRILHALEAQGFTSKKDWPHYYYRITSSVGTAMAMETRDPLPYASEAKSQLDTFGDGITAALSAFERMPPEIQDTLGPYLEVIIGGLNSLSSTERTFADRLLSPGRLQLLLGALKEAVDMAKGPLGKQVQPVHEYAMRLLPDKVKEAVHKNSQMKPRRRGQNLFPYEGARRIESVRYVVAALYAVFKQATLKPPTVSKNLRKNDFESSS